MKRRDFMKSLGLSAIAMVYPATRAFGASQSPRYLVLLELHGGNDGLNTVAPLGDPLYSRLRPNLALKRDQVISLSEQLGLNTALEPLMTAWRGNELAVVLGVGYPEPNRSHFRSIEIWDTASDSGEYLQTGWLARALANRFGEQAFAADGIVIGRNPAPLTGDAMRTVVINDIDRFVRQAQRMESLRRTTDNPALAHLLSVQQDLRGTADALQARMSSSNMTLPEFPNTLIGRHMKEAARLLVSGAAAPVIKVSHGSFDTHSNQRGLHDRLLGQLAVALTAFREAMIEAGLWDQVLIMSYSEFGRRAAENASRGTDHGTAAPHFFLGGRVKGGLYGEQPSLTDLDAGDLKYRVDFRRLYATVVNRWWGLTPTEFDGTRFAPLDCLRV